MLMQDAREEPGASPDHEFYSQADGQLVAIIATARSIAATGEELLRDIAVGRTAAMREQQIVLAMSRLVAAGRQQLAALRSVLSS